MAKKIKIPLLATGLILILLFFQGLEIIFLTKNSIDSQDSLDLMARSSEITKDIKELNFSSNLVYKHAILDRNLNVIRSNLEFSPPNFEFEILKFRGNLYYKSYFFYENELYYLVISKKSRYEKLTFLAIFYLIITFFIISLIMYFTYKSIVTPHLEQKKMMNTFFNDAMHELKTPLGVASINLEMLEVRNKFTHRIKAALKQMKITYEDVEFFIKNEKIKFAKKVINLSSFLENRIRFVNSVAKSKNLEIISEISPNLEVFMSEVEITRVIDNTLTNAIKYSNPENSIIITLKKDDKFATFSVKDFGIGIKDKAKIWDRYQREDRSQGGFGLGLSIVLEICLKNEISYSVESVYKKGSTFTYKIPLFKEKALDYIS